MIRAAEAAGEWSADDLKYIVVNDEYRSVYEILGVPAESTRKEIDRAARDKQKTLHPDLLFQRIRAQGREPSAEAVARAQGYFQAISEAKDKALEILDRATKGKGTAATPASEPSSQATVAAATPETPPSAPTTTEDGDPIVDGKVYGHTLEEWNAMGPGLKAFDRNEAKAVQEPTASPQASSKQPTPSPAAPSKKGKQERKPRSQVGSLAEQLVAKGMVPGGGTAEGSGNG
jgi:curved DNA-binding protein CbpA